MSDSLVSIIIPTFNARQWLGVAIDSALAQTHRNCEVLVIDDGSTDGTREWLADKYGDQIKYFYKSNGGLGNARNVGLRNAHGEYVQFLDSDDLMLPEKVATHAEYLLRHPGTDIVYGHIVCFDDAEPERLFDWDRKDRYCSGNVFQTMLYDGFLLIHAPLSRKQCIERVGGFDGSAPSRCVDWDFWLRLAWSGASFSYLPGPAMAYYRIRAGHMSSSTPDVAYSGLRVLAKVPAYVQDPQQQKLLGLPRARGLWRFRYGKALVEDGQLRRGLYEMARGILADRKDLDYKLSFMALVLLAGPERATRALQKLKKAKQWVTSPLGRVGRR